MSNLPAIIGTALAVGAALALLWSSISTGSEMREGFGAAERRDHAATADRDAATADRDAATADRDAATADRDAIRSDLDAATTERNAIRSDVRTIRSDVRTILERLLPEPAEPTTDDEPAEPTDDESSPQTDDVDRHGPPAGFPRP